MSATSDRTAALVTPSYAGDLERCRLLCESVDRFVTGARKHYLLVAGHDVARFRTLESAHRVVIDERDILPARLYALRDPTSLFRRHIWVGARMAPLRGWHVQQLRRIAIAGAVPEAALVYCDSDVLFLRPFDVSAFWRGDDIKLYRAETDLAANTQGDHLQWVADAGRVLGLPPVSGFKFDYISTVIAWRRETVLSMMRHIEARHGRDWLSAVAARRRFSECFIYGRYVDEVLGGAGHFHDDTEFCRVYWGGPGLDEQALRAFAEGMTPRQVAIGIQSFTGTNLSALRALLHARSP